MKNLLFVLGIFCLLVSCKKESVEPIPGVTMVDSVNTLPTFVYTSKSNDPNHTVYRFYYYPNNLLKKVIQYDSLYNPDQKDSTLYFYNWKNQLIKKIEYTAGRVKYRTEISYTIDSRYVETVMRFNEIASTSTSYFYFYASLDNVAFVLGGNDQTNVTTDSIVVDDEVFIHYHRSNATEAYSPYNPEHCFMTPNGVYYDTGVRNPGSPDADQWGYVYNDNSLRPVCIDKTINFQHEVAEKFIPMGSYTDYPENNYYITPQPLKYCTYSRDAMTGYVNDYTFDQDNRLVRISGRFNYFDRGGSPIPGSLTTIIRY